MRTDDKEDVNFQFHEGVESATGGSNFLVSAILHMRRQKRDLQREISILKQKVQILEKQNAAFLNLSADRLINS